MAFLKHSDPSKPPVLLKLRSSPGLIVTTASFAVFTDIFLYGVIVPILPFSLENRIHVGTDHVQFWISIALATYGAALLVSSPVWGYLADVVHNRRNPMLIGLFLLAGATIFLCLAKNIAMLLIGRALQGASSALTWTVGLALVVDTVGKDQVGMAMGWIGMSLSLGILTSPLLGGVVYGKAGYYPVFAMCFGLIAVDIVLRLSIIEIKDAKQWLDNDEPRLEEALPQVPGNQEKGGQDLPTATGNISAATQTHHNPFATLWKLLKKPRLSAALWGTLVEAIIHSSLDSTVPLFVSETFHWDSIGAGLIFLPVVIPTFLSPLIGKLCDRYGPKWAATFGFLFAVPFFVCLRFVSKDTMGHKVMLCGLLLGIGIAVSFIIGPLMAEITWGTEDEENESGPSTSAQAYGLYNMAFSGGTLVGPIMGGMIRDRAGWGTVGWSMAIVMFFTAITQLIWTGGPLSLKFRKS